MKLNKINTKVTCIIFAMLFSINLSATTWEVNDPGDDNVCHEDNCTLRAVISQAVAGDTINITTEYEVQIMSPLIIEIPLLINGNTSVEQTVINGNYSGETIFHVTSSAVLSLNNLIITKGGGANQSQDFSSNQPFGAIYLDNDASLNTSQVYFTGNNIAIANNAGNLNIDQTDFFFNDNTSKGAAIYSNGGEVIINDSNFSFNFSQEGGAINYGLDFAPVNSANNLVISNSNFTDVGSIYIEGGIGMTYPINLDISNTNFSNLDSSPIVINSQEVIATISNSSFVDNQGHDGGAINALEYNSLQILKSNFSNNQAYGDGGAIATSEYSTGPIFIVDSTFNMNEAVNGNGGAVFARGVFVLQSTFYQNTAQLGGALSAYSLDVAYSTFSKNNANYDGNILFVESDMHLEASILLDDFVDGSGAACATSSGNTYFIHSQGGVLSNDESCVTTSGGVYPYDILLSDNTPILEKLAENGGVTPTIALVRSTNNPAIDTIPVSYCENYSMSPHGEFDISKDQRGMDRPQGAGCDIGAYELDVAELPYEIHVEKISNLSHAFQNIEFNNTHPTGYPVVIAGVVTTNGIDAGTIRLKDVTDYSFSIKFQEFDKDRENGESGYAHNLTESLSVMKTGVGVKTLMDGTVIETLKFDLGDDVFDGSNAGVFERKQIDFTHYFSETPLLLCSIQTFNGSQAVFTKVEELNNHGFKISLVEQEFNNLQGNSNSAFIDLYGHVVETIGCVAIALAENTDWATSQTLWADERIQSTKAGGEIHLQEDLSNDIEVDAEEQKINLLWIEEGYNSHMFGEIIIPDPFFDQATLRQCVPDDRGCDILKGDI